VSDEAPRRSLLGIESRPGPETTLVLTGELDPATAPTLEARLAEVTADGDVRRVVLDLAQITFLDSSGLRTLVAANEALRARAAELVLQAPTSNIRRVLEVTGLTELIELR
jgi:stage II sporulation protein AA (anti-sigma F factor antagonist)